MRKLQSDLVCQTIHTWVREGDVREGGEGERRRGGRGGK